MMDNLTANKSDIPRPSWLSQNGWSTTSAQGPLLNPLSSSQHLILGSSSDQRTLCDRLQTSSRSCMSDLSTLASTHHSALYKTSHISSNPSSTTLFANTAIPSTLHNTSFAHTSSGKNIPTPSLPQTNQAPQPCRHQHLPILSPQDLYKASVPPPLTSQDLPDLPISLPSCAQHVSTCRDTFEGASVEFAGVCGYTHSHASSTSQEQRQWMPSSHCRGAENESVADAASHLNKEPSQEENVSPLASNDTRRSVLLHQRAQLLKQLAELDQLLKSEPADDGSEVSPRSVNQTAPKQTQQSKFQSRLSSVSCDEQSDAFDDDPMSAAESEEPENLSAESENETDPDYIPKTDDDLSDFKSESDWGSSDESSYSTPSSSTGEASPAPRKKKAKSESSFFRSVSRLKQPRAANQKKKKKSAETVVVPSSSSKAQRVYDKRNYCVFCSKPVSKMARHLGTVHVDKPEVAAAFQYPKNSKERQRIWNRLTKLGNFAHNKVVLKTGKGQLAVRQRPNQAGKAKDFLHCLYCRGLYVRKALYRHMKLCPEKVRNEDESDIGRRRIALRCVLETSDDLDISDAFKTILSQMTYDDVTQAVMDDGVILQFGELLVRQHGTNVKRHDYIRQNLRQLARLVLEAQKITPLKKMEDFFHPSNFPHVVSAVNVVAGYDPEKNTYSVPSLAIKLGYHLQKACSIVESNAVKDGNTSLAESAQNFLSEYKNKWNKLISGGALTTLRETKLNSEKKVPFAQDVSRLNFYMENVHLLAEKKLRDSPSPENYASLAKVLLAQIIIFNRRSAAEVASVRLTDFMSRKKTNVLSGMDLSVSDLERTMCEFFTRVDIRGKCGRMVPVLLKPSIVTALELLVKVRETCRVSSKNPFLFGRPNALSAYSGSESVQKYAKACGAEDPKALTSTTIRKHYTTKLQLHNLNEKQGYKVSYHNGQARALQEDSGLQLDDVQMDPDARLQPARGHEAASWYHDEHSSGRYGPAQFYYEQTHAATTTGANMTAPPKSVNSGKKGSHNTVKHKWEEAEVLAVERHMMRFIQGHKVPQKKDCIQCLEAEPEALRTRSWKGVKDYVRNRITALKRQSGTNQSASTHAYWPGQEEAQQSSVYFQQL